MVLIDVDGEVYHAIEAAVRGGESCNQVVRRLLGLPPWPDPQLWPSPIGELARLVSAGLVALGEPLYPNTVTPGWVPVAHLAEGGLLRAEDGSIYPGPNQLVGALRGQAFAQHGWACLTTGDGTRLETLRQRHLAETAPHLLPAGPGVLAPLIAAGLLAAGDELRLPIHLLTSAPGSEPFAVRTATVTENGCFLLPEGDLYTTGSGAAAAHRGNPFSTRSTWLAPDGRRLTVLRDLARDLTHGAHPASAARPEPEPREASTDHHTEQGLHIQLLPECLAPGFADREAHHEIGLPEEGDAVVIARGHVMFLAADEGCSHFAVQTTRLWGAPLIGEGCGAARWDPDSVTALDPSYTGLPDADAEAIYTAWHLLINLANQFTAAGRAR
jgi:hypothetical protein